VANTPKDSKVAEKANEIKTNVEASQSVASQSDLKEEAVVERPRSVSHDLPEEGLDVLGGYPVPKGAEKDATIENERKFFAGPGPDHAAVKIKEGEPVDGDVWEAVYQNNAKLPTYVLVAAKGQVLDLGRTTGDFRLNDFGPRG